jgi:hypothetical protein
MEFLDPNLTKDSNLSLQAIHRFFYQRFLKKTILFSGFKNPYKKTKKIESIYSILENQKMRAENQTKTGG